MPLHFPAPSLTAGLVPLLGLLLSLSLDGLAQSSGKEAVFQLEPFRVTAYHGDIKIIDGFTGKAYEGTNRTVTKFAQSFNKLLLGYHKKLVLDEVKHLELRIKLGEDFDREMGLLAAAFGFSTFERDRSTWLSRERAIITRLIRKPFFKVKALVAWDLDRLQGMAPRKPDSKHARDIRFNEETGRWERRITIRWDVFFRNNPARPESSFGTEKTQGLNLDTLRGYHFIEVGLPGNVPPLAFQEVALNYPVFFSDQLVGERDLQLLQRTLLANLHFIYDPFSWVARRDARFRGGFIQDCLEHIQSQRIPVDDRPWFDPVFARFLSDVVTIKLQGAEEIYSLHMVNQRHGDSPRALGLSLDLLNWNPGEAREAPDRPESEPQISLTGQNGFRYVLLDAYQRFGDALVEQIRHRLQAQNESRQTTNGRALLTGIIEELAGTPYDEFALRAKTTQEARLAEHKGSHLRRKPAAGQ